MILTRLTYFSRIRLDDPIDEGIAQILGDSVVNNQRDRITGALVYDREWFAQMLEGREAVVSETFERILRDRRHSNVTLVVMQPVAERRFANCWMMGCARNADNADLFRHYGESEEFDPRQMRADRLCDLIEALADKATLLQEGTQWTTRNASNAA
jgi:hypothetical protein